MPSIDRPRPPKVLAWPPATQGDGPGGGPAGRRVLRGDRGVRGSDPRAIREPVRPDATAGAAARADVRPVPAGHDDDRPEVRRQAPGPDAESSARRSSRSASSVANCNPCIPGCRPRRTLPRPESRVPRRDVALAIDAAIPDRVRRLAPAAESPALLPSTESGLSDPGPAPSRRAERTPPLPSGRPIEVGAAAVSPEEMHGLIRRRMEALEREQKSHWRRIIDLMRGPQAGPSGV